MSKQSFTPGPWEVGRGYMNTGYPCYWISGMSGEQKRDVPVLDANARLIAEAPDFYAAAEIAIVELESVEREIGVPSKALPLLRAAIARATLTADESTAS